MLAQKKLVDRPATFQDLAAVPSGLRAEIIDGVLYTMPRPSPEHQNAIAGAGEALRSPMQRGKGGPGGWWILPEPGIRITQSPEFSPDLAGWKKSRVPMLPRIINVVPDWICEVLSPGNKGYDQIIKRAFYARIGVGWLWYVDPEERTLQVSRLHEGQWLELGIWGEDQTVRAEPFEEVEVRLEEWWLPKVPETPEESGEGHL